MTTADFYDRLAPFYHLIFADWPASMARQAEALDGIIKEVWGDSIQTVLDAACGIGTQAIGLAQRGYKVTGSDLSAAEVERARREAVGRGLDLELSVADMRRVDDAHHLRQFDLVIACDNAIPHLLTDADILEAFAAFYRCIRPGGGCLITVRDYEQEERSGLQLKPYGLRVEGETRTLLFQVWEFHGSIYELALYLVEDRGGANCTTQVMRASYYAVGIDRLTELMSQAGFGAVQRLDGRFYQPVIIGGR